MTQRDGATVTSPYCGTSLKIMKMENSTRRAANESPWNMVGEMKDSDRTNSPENRVTDRDAREKVQREKPPLRKAITWGL